MKTLIIAALAVVSLAACGGPVENASPVGHTTQGLELTVPVPTLPAPSAHAMEIIDVVDATDIVATPKERIEQLRTGRASFESAYITSDFQRGSGGGCH